MCVCGVYMFCGYHLDLLNSTDIEMLKKTEVATLKKDSEETKEQLKKLKGMFQVRGNWVSSHQQFMALCSNRMRCRESNPESV